MWASWFLLPFVLRRKSKTYSVTVLQPEAHYLQRPQGPHLVQTLGGRHGSLDGQASNVLPALLQQRDQVVDGQHDVADELLLGHANVADSDTHAQNLLQLELDGRLDVGDLVREVIGVRDGSGELAGCTRRRSVSIKEHFSSD